MKRDSLNDTAPEATELTEYDLAHAPIYLRLLDAERAGASWGQAAETILGLDVKADPARARRVYDSHLARARWMQEQGYRQLAARSRVNAD